MNSQEDESERVLTRDEAAEWLRVSVRHFDYLVAAGKIRVSRVGRCVRVLLSELMRYMRGEGGQSNQVGAT